MESWNTKLLAAAEAGDIKMVTDCLKYGADVHCRDQFGETPLHWAAAAGQTETAGLLIAHNSNVGMKDIDGWTPLHFAAARGRLDTIGFLILHGANIDIQDNDGHTPYDLANKKDIEILFELIEIGVDVSRAIEAAKRCNSLEVALEYIQNLSNAGTSDILPSGSDLDILSRIKDETTFKILLSDGTYESYGNRIYLGGACNVGKSTLTSLLIGDEIPQKWKSTDGLRIFFGRTGIDVKSKKMVPLKKGEFDLDVLSNVLRGRPDLKQDPSNEDMHLIKTLPDTGTVKQNVESGIAVSTSSVHEQSSPGLAPPFPSFEEETRITVTPENIQKLSLLKFTSIHKDIKQKILKGKYRVNIAPSDLVDFGGQKSYDMTHQLFIQGKGTFTLIFDGRKRLHDPLKEYQQKDVTTESILKHWVDSILTYCGEDDDDILPVILFVATHKDQIKEDERSKKIREFNDGLAKMFQNHERQKRIEYSDIFFINAKDECDREVIRLKEKYVDIAFKQKSWGRRMPMAWVPLELQMNAMRENNISIISKKELRELNTANDDLALTEPQLNQFLQDQHSTGKILYFEGQGLGKYIIVQPTTLVDILRSFITDEMFWPSDENLNGIFKEMAKSGKIKKRDLFRLWSQKELHQHMPRDDFKEFIAQVLVHLDLLVESNIRESFTSEFYLVPCAIKQEPPTIDFDKILGNNRTLCLAYKLLKSSIPSALSFKLIGASMNVWPLKETEKGTCLYHKAAIFCIDKSNTLHFLVQNDRVIVCLENEISTHFISPDVASCVQECLTLTLTSCLEFYHNSFGKVVPKLNIAKLFEIEVVQKCEAEFCHISLTDTKMKPPPWICSHGREHKTEFMLYWTYKIHQNCSIDCKGLDEQFLNLCPEDKHLARLARLIGIKIFDQFIINLGLSREDWDRFDYKHHRRDPLMIQHDILCHWKNSADKPTFNDLCAALTEIKYDKHYVCQIFREDTSILELKDKILQDVPGNEVLLDLSRQIRSCAIHLGVELGIDFCQIEETMFKYNRDMFEQNYDILMKWKNSTSIQNKTIRYLMHILKIVNPGGCKFLKKKYHIAE